MMSWLKTKTSCLWMKMGDVHPFLSDLESNPVATIVFSSGWWI